MAIYRSVRGFQRDSRSIRWRTWVGSSSNFPHSGNARVYAYTFVARGDQPGLYNRIVAVYGSSYQLVGLSGAGMVWLSIRFNCHRRVLISREPLSLVPKLRAEFRPHASVRLAFCARASLRGFILPELGHGFRARRAVDFTFHSTATVYHRPSSDSSTRESHPFVISR